MCFIPFVVHFKVVPERGFGKRFEYVRDLQKLALLVYEKLITISSVNLATPGGGQQTSRSGNGYGSLGGAYPACAVKPQFGEAPAQLQLAGFDIVSASPWQPRPPKMIIAASANNSASISGPSDKAQTAAQTDDAVKALKLVLETAATQAVPGGVQVSVFRLDYAGVVYGDRGHHFPQ